MLAHLGMFASLLLLTMGAVAQSPLDVEQDAAKAPMPGMLEAGHGTPALIDIRIAAIEQELKELAGQHPWAGEYYWGDGLGANLSLRIADQTGFAITWHGCLGLYGANEGLVKKADGRLILDFRWRNLERGFGHFARELVPVRWGERQYLIDANDIAGFVNDIHSGSEPRKTGHGLHFLRRGDHEKAAPGWPDLAPEWLQQLQVEPALYRVRDVRAEPVVKNGRRCTLRAELTLDPISRAVDLRPGIELRSENDEVRDIKVQRTEAGVVIATWTRLFSDCGDKDEPPAVGATLTTGAFVPTESADTENLW